MNKEYKDGTYYCINNGFASNFKLDSDTHYQLEFRGNGFMYNVGRLVVIIRSKKFAGSKTWEVEKWQDFDDYFISAAEWRDSQINSILYDEV